jgi:two-component SAPR family response regulator
MKILFMSGYTETAAFNNGILRNKAGFLQKPFKMNRLVRKIRGTLDAKE